MPPFYTAGELAGAIRSQAMHRLVEGCRAGGDLMVQILKATVAGAPTPDLREPARATPFLYVEPGGRVRGQRARIDAWQGARYVRDVPPGIRSGAGRETICFEIRDVDVIEGRLVLWLGNAAGARGGLTTLQSYLFAWDLGIRRRASSPVIQRPWLRASIARYRAQLAYTIVGVARGVL
jgi:hypothetical protein